jgi:type III pantothenate kinase
VTRRVVAVDVGNSTVGLAAQIDDQFVPHFVSLDDADWISECIRWAQQQLGSGQILWTIASVQASATAALMEDLSKSDEYEVHQTAFTDVPMEVTVEYPEKLGIDRLLAAHAATRILEPPFAVVDVGSAITVDWVDPLGRFCGGAILPGLALQATALHRGTDALPILNVATEEPVRLPGRNTTEAIRGGILVGAAAAIDALTNRYARSHDTLPPSIALTGGQAVLIAPLLQQNHRLLPNLVCRGLLELARSKRYAKSESGFPPI